MTNVCGKSISYWMKNVYRDHDTKETQSRTEYLISAGHVHTLKYQPITCQLHCRVLRTIQEQYNSDRFTCNHA